MREPLATEAKKSRLGPTCISHRTLGSVVAIDPEDPIVAIGQVATNPPAGRSPGRIRPAVFVPGGRGWLRMPA